MWFDVTVSAATVITIKIGAVVIWERDFAAAGGAEIRLPPNGPLGAVDDLVTFTTSQAVTVGASAAGTEEP